MQAAFARERTQQIAIFGCLAHLVQMDRRRHDCHEFAFSRDAKSDTTANEHAATPLQRFRYVIAPARQMTRFLRVVTACCRRNATLRRPTRPLEQRLTERCVSPRTVNHLARRSLNHASARGTFHSAPGAETAADNEQLQRSGATCEALLGRRNLRNLNAHRIAGH